MDNYTADTLHIISFNCNGLRDRLAEIKHLIATHDLDIIALNELKIEGNRKINIPEFNFVQYSRNLELT